MSKQDILSMISRIERMADTMPGRSQSEITSLCGQIIGTLRAIREEFGTYGISTNNESMGNAAYGLGDSTNVSDYMYIIHQAAGYFRGLANRMP
jgi:hypothetical protein